MRAICVLVALLGAAALALVVIVGPGQDARRSVLGHPTFSMLSGSMSPVIRTGDLVIDRPVTSAQASSLHVGQVITFESRPGSSRLFTHRIVAVSHLTDGSVAYTTKGDANDAPDANPVPAADVVGTYYTKIPAGGYVLADLRRPSFLLTLLLVPGLIALAVSLFRRARRAQLGETQSGAGSIHPVLALASPVHGEH